MSWIMSSGRTRSGALSPGAHLLRGAYSRGCLDDLPLSEALCTDGPFEVQSLQFGVVP
jgi:hypothetical protein